ncbi:MAG: TMEM165/GDT1 family protein [Anaerolineae bacterium]
MGAALAFIVTGFLTWREGRKVETDACRLLARETCAQQAGSWDWRAFVGTFSLLFLAELGDKTQLAVLGLSSKPSAAWLAFTSGSLALAVVTAVGVLGGEKLCKWIPQGLLLRLSALAFVMMGALIGVGLI